MGKDAQETGGAAAVVGRHGERGVGGGEEEEVGVVEEGEGGGGEGEGGGEEGGGGRGGDEGFAVDVFGTVGWVVLASCSSW